MDFNKLKHITTFIFDVDGVLTDGTVIALNSGEQARSFSVKDGFAIKKAIDSGYNMCIISGGFQEGTKKRLEMLNIKDINLGVGDKKEVFNSYLSTNSINADNVIYVGDDLPDLEVMQLSGISACPEDACTDILNIANYISPRTGGNGVVRDVIEKVLRIQNKWL